MSIHAVTFDVGGTLIEPWPSVGHVYAEVAARHGVAGVSPELLRARFKAAWQASRDFNYSRAGWEKLVRLTFEGVIEPERLTFFPELYNRFAQADAWRIFDDVLPALKTLSSRELKLGIISNWDDRLHPLLERLKLDPYFPVKVISCDAGATKPSPAIFHLAATKLGEPAGSILHIGDSFELDVLGARNAGFHALRIRREAEQTRPDDLPSLTGIASWIDRSSAGN